MGDILNRNDNKRFSDDELHKLYAAFKDHVEYSHRENAATRKENAATRKQIEQLQESNAKIEESTQGIVAAWTAVSGAVKVAAAIGKFSLWILSLAGIFIILDWLKKYFGGA